MTAEPGEIIRQKLHEVARLLPPGRPVQIMEVCGTHTMAIARGGLKALWSDSLRLISGPGCPVCVTDQSYIDRAVFLADGAAAPIVATYGDMIRVPGEGGSLAEARANGAVVEVVYSADQAVELAKRNAAREVVFLAVGFETTAPGTALAVLKARAEGVANFSVLTSHKRIVPAMQAILSADEVQVDGFLCPGHVSVILGYRVYAEIVSRHGCPCVVAGFEPTQILQGLEEILRQLQTGRPEACSAYPSVSRDGNAAAKKLLDDVFVIADERWRAMGVIEASGMVLRDEFGGFDAARKFQLPEMPSRELPDCRCGDVLRGLCDPADCPMFGAACVPRDPVGPCMVSSEGACAAAFKYERHDFSASPKNGAGEQQQAPRNAGG